MAASAHNPRHIVLIGLLLFLAGVWAVHTGRVWYFEQQLDAIGQAIIYRDWSHAVSGAKPECDVSIHSTCTFSYLVVGEKFGKIQLVFSPRPDNPSRVIYEALYYYIDEDDEWAQSESFAHATGIAN